MKSPELTEFFSLLGKAKKEKEEEFDNLLKEADINLDALTSTVFSGIKEAKVNEKKQKKKEEKLIEQLDSIIDVIENPKEVKDITEPAVTVGVPENFDVSKLEEEDPLIVQDWNNGDDIKFTEVDAVDIIKPEPIKTPEISDTVANAIKFIEETNIKEEIENSDEKSIDDLKGEIKQVRDILYKVLAHGPGSGEVNLLKLDDVDEDSAKVDGKFLKYDDSSGKFIGADASGAIAGISTTGTSVFNEINASGVTTAAQFSGYSHLIAPHASTITITVKVATKIDGEHRYYGQGSSLGYNLNDVQSPFLTLTPGRTYRFDQSDSSNGGHPLRFYYDAAKATSYTTNITTNGTAGSSGAYTEIAVTDTTPTVLHYQCTNHGYMGNAVQVNSNVIDTPSGGTVRGSFTATGGISGTTITGSGAISGTTITGSSNASFYNRIQLRSDDSTPARIDLYCEANNAHYLRLQAPAHSQFSGNPTVTLPNSAGTVALTSSNITGTSAGLSGTPNITVGSITNTTITGSSNASFYNQIKLRSDDSTPARIDLYCEANNAHYLRLQAPPHSQFSGNPTVVLPNSAGTLLLSDGSGADLTNLNASNLGSGTIPDARFPSALPAIDGSALTGIGAGSTDNIRTNTNATFLQNVNVSGTTTAANFIGGGANITSINASNISSGTIGAARIPTLNQNTTGTSAGLTGTPDITVGSIVASTGTFSGNVTIGGTLTYEDVTNIDSVGLVTARSGLVVGTGVTLSKDGDGFYTGIVTATTFVGGLTGNVTGNVSGSSGSTTGNAATATALESARTIGGVSFDGTSNIDLPGVNSAGNQDTTGNAATATILANARTIAGTSFNGSANIDIDFDNLTNKPTIPTNNNQLTNGAGFIDGSALNASNLSSGTIPNARFPSVLPAIDGSALTGMASTDNVRTGILDVAGISTFRNDIIVGTGVTVSPDGDIFATGVTTATTFVGALTGDVTGTASNATLAVSAQGLTGSPNITVTDVNAVDAIISGNLSVAGTITSLDQNDILATGIITASSGVDLGDPGIITLSSDTLTTTSSSADTVASVSASANRSATFQVQVTRGTEYHVTTINVVHDGTNAFLSEYGTIRTGSTLATFDADISGGNLRLRVTPTSTASTVFKLSKTVIKV